MEHRSPTRRPKRSKDPIKAAWQVFQEVTEKADPEPKPATGDSTDTRPLPPAS